MRKKRGFSLIEAAIVLGIVGLVIGGIWTAASAVNHNLRMSRTFSGIILMLDNVRALYAKNPPATEELTNEVINKARLAPADWLDANGYDVVSPIGGLALWAGPYYGEDGLKLGIYDSTTKECIELLTGIGAKLKDPNMLHAISVESEAYITTFPVTLTDATTKCNSGTVGGRVHWVGFYLRY